jgi:ATP-dependent DNA helicase 2 subunit 2
MADKEATVYVIDVGKSMGRQRNGRSISDLDWAMKYVWDKITTTASLYNGILCGIQFGLIRI